MSDKDFNSINELMGAYILEHRGSPYNNRRNKLRHLADAILGSLYGVYGFKCDQEVGRLVGYPDKSKGCKGTFNSFRSALSPSVLEEFVMHVYNESPMMANDTYCWEGMSREAHIWVERSVSSIINESYGFLPWGSSEFSGNHKEVMASIDRKFGLITVSSGSNKKEIKNVQGAAHMAQVNQIVLDGPHKVAVDAILGMSGGFSVDAINVTMNKLTTDAEVLSEDNKVLAGRLATALSAASKVIVPTTVTASSDGSLPDGDVVMKVAESVFDDCFDGDQKKMAKALLSFEVPVFEWSGYHPDVPTIDVNYEYDVKALFRVLQGIVDSNNTYLFGHTGTGKSTLVEQVCARLNFPLVRVNFDSEISRMDLVGRDTLVQENGQTVSKFVDGVLPDALSRPCLLLCDEVDFIRPDVMYVFQRVLEGNGLLISEDGGRKVLANPWFRLVATANTCGQGDESGMYMGARPQSMATLDRFENWVSVDYMQPEKEKKWLQKSHPNLMDADASKLISYAQEHRQAFMGGKIMQPLSPRGLNAMAKRFVNILEMTKDGANAMEESFGSTILDRCTSQDKVVIQGLYQRVIK